MNLAYNISIMWSMRSEWYNAWSDWRCLIERSGTEWRANREKEGTEARVMKSMSRKENDWINEWPRKATERATATDEPRRKESFILFISIRNEGAEWNWRGMKTSDEGRSNSN